MGPGRHRVGGLLSEQESAGPEGRDHVDEILHEWAIEKPEVDVSAQGIVGRVLRLSRYFERDLGDTFRQFDIRGGEFDVLATLRRCGDETGLPASELASRCMLSSAAMTNRLDGLEAADLVQRVMDTSDRRVVRIQLTATGRRLIDEAFPAHAANQDRMVDLLTASEREQLTSLLRRLLASYEHRGSASTGTAVSARKNGVSPRRRATTRA